MSRAEQATVEQCEDFDPAFLERSFRRHLGCDGIRIRRLTRYPRGVSRETWFLCCEVERASDTTVEDFVLRRDLPGGSICAGELRAEYEIYRRLNGSGIPVAQTLWYEDDVELLGGRRQYYVRRHVDGDWDIPGLLDRDPRYDALRIDIGREHVRRLAQVHACDWRALRFDEILDAPASPRDSARHRVEQVVAGIERYRVQPLPLVSEAAEWLIDHPPPDSGRVCLVKGTNGLGEEIFRGTEIVAMSDWELCCLGDPAMDFALAQNFLDDVVVDGRLRWGMQPALDYYLELTGTRIHLDAVKWYKQMYGLYRIQFSQAAARQLESGDLLCRLPWLALEIAHVGQVALANAIGCTDGPLPEMGQRG